MIGTPSEDESLRGPPEFGPPRDESPRDESPRDAVRLHVLAELGLMLASSDDHISILHKLAKLVAPELGDWCSVHLLDAYGRLECVATGRGGAKRIELAPVFENGGPCGARRIVATGRSECIAVVSDELLAHQGYTPWQRDALRALGVQSYLAVPLVVRARVTGVLTLVRAASGAPYDADDLAFAEELARRVAMYTDHALLLREIQARETALRDEAARLEILNRIGQQLAAIHELDEVVKRVCDAATALTGAEIGVFVANIDGDVKHAVCGATLDEAERIAGATMEGAARGAPRPARIGDVRGGPPVELGPLANLPRVIAYLAVPVRGRRGDVIGGIALGHSRAGAFDSRDEQLVMGLASLTATAIDSARLFREAHELIAALEKSNRDLDEFAYVTSHDLRAPLRGIANLSRWIEEDLGGRLTEGAREHLRLLRSRVRRLEDLISGVLTYSRAGAEAEAPIEVDCGALVREVVELLAPPSHVRFEIAADLPRLCTCRVPLQQVFMNLVSNAITHNGRPDPQIAIGCSATADGWEFHVRDNGPGIPLRYQPQIWGLFRTLHARGSSESTGIGLAIVRKIVEAQGGRAWVESEEGEGATFRFTWPLERPRSWRRDG